MCVFPFLRFTFYQKSVEPIVSSAGCRCCCFFIAISRVLFYPFALHCACRSLSLSLCLCCVHFYIVPTISLAYFFVFLWICSFVSVYMVCCCCSIDTDSIGSNGAMPFGIVLIVSGTEEMEIFPLNIVSAKTLLLHFIAPSYPYDRKWADRMALFAMS